MILKNDKIFAYFAKYLKNNEKPKYNISYYRYYNEQNTLPVRRGFAYNNKSSSTFLNSLFKELETFLNRNSFVEQYVPNKSYDKDTVLVYNNQLVITTKKLERGESIDGKYKVLSVPNDPSKWITTTPKLPYFSIDSLTDYVLNKLPKERTIVKNKNDVTNWSRIHNEMKGLLYSYKGDSLNVSPVDGEFFRNLIYNDKALYSNQVSGGIEKDSIVKKWIFLNSSFSNSKNIRAEFWNKFPKDANINICNRYLYDNDTNLQSPEKINKYRWRFKKTSDAIVVTHHYDNLFSVSGIEKIPPRSSSSSSISPNRSMSIYLELNPSGFNIISIYNPVSSSRRWTQQGSVWVSPLGFGTRSMIQISGYREFGDTYVIYFMNSAGIVTYLQFNLSTSDVNSGVISGSNLNFIDYDSSYGSPVYTSIKGRYFYTYNSNDEYIYYNIVSPSVFSYIGKTVAPITEYRYLGTDIAIDGRYDRWGGDYTHSGTYLITDHISLTLNSRHENLNLTNIVNFRGINRFAQVVRSRNVNDFTDFGSINNPRTKFIRSLTYGDGVIYGINNNTNQVKNQGGYRAAPGFLAPESEVYFFFIPSKGQAYFSYPLYAITRNLFGRSIYKAGLTHKYAPGLLNVFNYAAATNDSRWKAPWSNDSWFINSLYTIDSNLTINFSITLNPTDYGEWEQVLFNQAYMNVVASWHIREYSSSHKIISLNG